MLATMNRLHKQKRRQYMSEKLMQDEMISDPKYIAMAVQEFLLGITRADVIHWGKYDQGISLEEFNSQLKGEEVEPEERPCYSVDLRFTLGYMEDVELREPKTPRQLKEPVVTGHSLTLYIEQLDENGEANEPGFSVSIPLEVAAQAERSHREHEELLDRITAVLNQSHRPGRHG
jgi:hypothetical protein